MYSSVLYYFNPKGQLKASGTAGRSPCVTLVAADKLPVFCQRQRQHMNFNVSSRKQRSKLTRQHIRIRAIDIYVYSLAKSESTANGHISHAEANALRRIHTSQHNPKTLVLYATIP